MNQEYVTKMEESMNSFMAREILRGQTIDPNKTYKIRTNDEHKYANVKGEQILEKTAPLHEIIRQRLEQDPTNQITQQEINKVSQDSATAAKYMIINLSDQLYHATIECATRMISNGKLLQDYHKQKPEEKEIITYIIAKAEKVKRAAHTAWENPKTFQKLIQTEETQNQEDILATIKIEDEMMK